MNNRSRQRWTSIGATLALAAALSSSLGAQQQTAQPSVQEGARVYGNMCGRCHNPRSPMERSDRDWVTISNHMRVRANLTGRQVRDVLAFLQATNTSPSERAAGSSGGSSLRSGQPSSDPTMIARGDELARRRACLGCHVIRDQGGAVGPTLNGVVARRGPDFVRRKLADPTIDKATSMMPNFGLSGDEIEAIVAFLASLGGR